MQRVIERVHLDRAPRLYSMDVRPAHLVVAKSVPATNLPKCPRLGDVYEQAVSLKLVFVSSEIRSGIKREQGELVFIGYRTRRLFLRGGKGFTNYTGGVS